MCNKNNFSIEPQHRCILLLKQKIFEIIYMFLYVLLLGQPKIASFE
jgi:hypothetical protein